MGLNTKQELNNKTVLSTVHSWVSWELPGILRIIVHAKWTKNKVKSIAAFGSNGLKEAGKNGLVL